MEHSGGMMEKGYPRNNVLSPYGAKNLPVLIGDRQKHTQLQF
jgi:hypothetical protein